MPYTSFGIVSKVQNTTLALSEDDDIQRRMLFLQYDWKATAMVPSYLLASFASLIKLPSYDNYRFEGSFTPELFANGAIPLSPLVGVQCNDTTSDLFIRDYYYELEGLDRTKEVENVQKSATIDIQSIWSEDELLNTVDGVQSEWNDVTGTTTTPVILALMLALMRHEQNVTVCAVQSYWTPTSQWVLSTSNYDITTNFTFQNDKDGDLGQFGYPYSLNAHKIHLHEDWIETLNAVNGTTKVLHDLLPYGINTTREAAPRPARNSTQSPMDMSYPYFHATISQLLAQVIANGISRIGAEYAADYPNRVYSLNEITVCDEKTQWCSQEPWFPSTIYATRGCCELDLR